MSRPTAVRGALAFQSRCNVVIVNIDYAPVLTMSTCMS